MPQPKPATYLGCRRRRRWMVQSLGCSGDMVTKEVPAVQVMVPGAGIANL
jgi:hypothetical protein